ncbi:MAG TPA: hypothetical protein VMV69_05415 [Pirellulales bacterium]|nr:hypothetical protein [Pirellulales bacterium]
MLFRPLAIVLPVFLAQTVSLAVAQAQVTLKHKFTEGATYKTREARKIKQSIGLGNTNINGKSDVNMTTTMVCGQRDSEKNLAYETTFDSIVADLEGFGSRIKFDSANPDAKSDNPIIEAVLDTFRKMKDMTLTFTLDKDNQLISVDGLDEGSWLSTDDFKQFQKDRLNLLPSEPVKPGDTWERSEEINLGQGAMFVIHRKYKYAGTTAKSPKDKDGPKLDKITAVDLSVEYKVIGDSLPIEVKESDLKVGSTKHTYLFDRELGRMVDERGEMQVKGSIKTSVMGTEVDGTLDLTMEERRQDVEVKQADKGAVEKEAVKK